MKKMYIKPNWSNGKTTYTIVETSTGRFRIATTTTFPDGFRYFGFLGGPRSKKYCFLALESAQKFLTEWEAMNARIKAADRGDV